MSGRVYYLLGFLLTMALWVAALFAPCTQILEAGRYVPRTVEPLRGYRLAEFGWLGPLGLSVAWYANIPYAFCIRKLFLGQKPSLRVSVVALAMALSALLPHAGYSEVYGWHRVYISGAAVWLWLGAFAVNALVALS